MGQAPPENHDTGTDTNAVDSGSQADGGHAEESIDETPCGTGEVTFSLAGMDFIKVCGGTFEMGCTTAQDEDGRCRYDEYRPLRHIDQ